MSFLLNNLPKNRYSNKVGSNVLDININKNILQKTRNFYSTKSFSNNQKNNEKPRKIRITLLDEKDDKKNLFRNKKINNLKNSLNVKKVTFGKRSISNNLKSSTGSILKNSVKRKNISVNKENIKRNVVYTKNIKNNITYSKNYQNDNKKNIRYSNNYQNDNKKNIRYSNNYEIRNSHKINKIKKNFVYPEKYLKNNITKQLQNNENKKKRTIYAKNKESYIKNLDPEKKSSEFFSNLNIKYYNKDFQNSRVQNLKKSIKIVDIPIIEKKQRYELFEKKNNIKVSKVLNNKNFIYENNISNKQSDYFIKKNNF